MTRFKHLFSPFKIGNLEIRNRVFMSPHGMAGLPIGSEAQAGYFEARARGGCGFMVIASCMVQPEPLMPPGWFIQAYDREQIPAIRNIVDAAHKHGSKIVMQGIWISQAAASGSAPHTMMADTQPRSMTVPEIRALVEAHVIAAQHAEEAGADGFEFPIGGGAGMQSFTSPLYNKRTDDYGGSLENRMRIIMEIIDGIRERCNPDFVVGLAVNADDSTLGGDGLSEGLAICKHLSDSGKVDWLRITARGQKPQMTHYHYPSSYMGEQGTHIYAAAEVKKVVDIPVVSGGRIVDPAFADQLIEDGKVDMIFVARSVIADPEWPNKAQAGELSEIRACIGDLEGCFLRSCIGHPVGCTVNPEIGSEYLGEPATTDRPKRVVIAGGGPAGMRAAYDAARRGHDVTLLERTGQLGGHVTMQAMLPGLEDRSDVIRWMELQLNKLNVDIRLHCEATPELIRELGAEAVIVTTGARYAKDGVSKNQLTPIPGSEYEHVFTPEEILLEHERVGKKIVIYDNTSYEVGPGIAELLADQGKEVFFVTIDSGMAMSVAELGVNKVISKRLMPKVTFIPDTQISEIDPENVTLTNYYTGETTVLKDVHNTILVTSKPPQDGLFHALQDSGLEVYVAGDAREAYWSVFGTDEAIKDGRRAAMML
ncbi:MAG: FAD-dependent oxidoreductase [Novosphingobium sp.]|nr:FAD-dependent oxidoreductase [Novosphingobium sp.]MCP5380087.1 FAD-dependent oxidoreductase [Novosphingobium sp.]MCP5388292.1 FAD-dependent oxidoreductase [Novosphingobium sp.]